MINRERYAEELMLREGVRSAIKVVLNRRDASRVRTQKDETMLREIIRDLLPEAKKIATYDNTGKNELNIFLLNSSFLSTLETTYRKLTTNFEQRKSYIDHMVAAVEGLLNRENSIADDAVDADVQKLSEEDINISIDDEDPKDDPRFMDDALEDEEEPEEQDGELLGDEGEVEFGDFALKGRDMTGAKNAYRDFKNIKDILRDAYGSLSAPEDKESFSEELPIQVALYGKAWEKTLQPDVGMPADIEAAIGGDIESGADPAGADPAVVPEDDIANIELQELLAHLNIDDIIENLL